MPLSRSILLLSGLLAGALTLPATTLKFSFVAVESQSLTVVGTPESCTDASGGTQYPLGCQFGLDSPGGHAAASVGGTELPFNATTLSSAYTFGGTAVASIFSQPGADTSNATSGFTFEALLSPVKSGDTFQFKLKDTYTCSNTLGSCTAADVLVYGAKSITGNLKTGETVTATGPVRLDLDDFDSVDNSLGIDNWTKSINTGLLITPFSETSPKRAHGLAGSSDELAQSSALVDTPEPGTIGLLGIAVVGLCLSKVLRGTRDSKSRF